MPPTIPVLFGTETGNSEYCADLLVEALEKEGFSADVVDMADFNPDETGNHPVLFIVTSTYGNGDPPANAERLLDFLQQDRPELSGVHFAVCGLGDTTFHYFAQCGKDFEKALLDCSATPMFDRVDCDEDYEVNFETFKETAVTYLKTHKENLFNDSPGLPTEKPSAVLPAESEATDDAVPSRDKNQTATLLTKKLLSKPGSAKETMHYELGLPDTDTDYRVGDCFAVEPKNGPKAIAAVLSAAGMTGEEAIQWRGEAMHLQQALQRACLQQVTLELVKLLAGQPGAENCPSAQILRQENALITAFLRDRHVVDILGEHNTESLDAQSFIAALRKLQPRLFSVASAPSRDARRVGFTIETVRYERNGTAVEGVATCWLADRVNVGDSINVRLVKNDDFQFPKDESPVIMVGPGTGIAPFRAYLDEVEASNSSNDTWLFFGHQHQRFDFLYEDEITRWLNNGTLKRAHFAWSRDQDTKVYVQHKIAEQSEMIWSWLKRGARIYVCGDAQDMAPAVEASFVSLALKEGDITDGQAWLEQLKLEGRYKTDVY